MKALGELAKPDNLRATFIAAATAGVMGHFGIVPPAAGCTDVVAHGTYALKSMAVRTPIEMVVSRRDPVEIVASNLRGALAATVANTLTSHIGQGMHPAGGEAPRFDVVTHKILHGIVGAGSAAIQGNDPLSGATGAIVGEIAGSIYRMGAMGELTPGTDAWDRAAATGSGIAQMVAAVSAMGLGLDASTAADAAGTATRNNCFSSTIAEQQAIRHRLDAEEDPERRAALEEDLAQAQRHPLQQALEVENPQCVQDFVAPWDQAVGVTQELTTQVRDALRGTPAMGVVSAVLPGAPLVLECLPHVVGALEAPKTVVGTLATVAPVGKVLGAGAKLGEKLLQKVAGSLGKSASMRLPTRVIERAIASKTGTPLASMGGTTASDLAASRFARGEAMRMQSSFHVPGGGPIRTTTATVTPKGAPKTPAVSSPASSSSGPSTPFDPTWRSKIQGKGQKTKTDGHAVRSMRVAIEAAKDPNVLRVHMDHGINRALGLTGEARIYSNRRPDVTIIYKDGRVDFIEVPSRTDDVDFLRFRIKEAMAKLPEKNQGETLLRKITVEKK